MTAYWKIGLRSMNPNELYLIKEIYRKNAIYKAIEDYRSISNIDMNENEKYYVCSFRFCQYDVQETIKEFENYIIDLMNCRDINESDCNC